MPSPPKTAEGFAPAKINLTLHVTGQRADGYHLLDSLVVFADVGDRVTVSSADRTTLTVSGLFADDVPKDDSNLVLRAAALIGAPPVAIHLQKNLPVASGVGGGSSDAAAALRALSELCNLTLPTAAELAGLGADVPVCLSARPVRMSGIGEGIAPLGDLPPLHLVLVNPKVAVTTPAVFAGLKVKSNAAMPEQLPDWQDADELAQWLGGQRNDLEYPARQICPEIGDVLARLGQTDGCLLARMSGSGATCFGLYATRAEADIAATAVGANRPDWWIIPALSWQLG